MQPGFRMEPADERVVEAISRRLDGLPLAIEMAVARRFPVGSVLLLDDTTDRGDAGVWKRSGLPLGAEQGVTYGDA